MSGCPCRKGVWWTYNLLGWLVSPAFGWYAVKRLCSGTSWSAYRDWTGRFPAIGHNRDQRLRFWVHAVSVGEMMAAGRLIDALRQRWSDAQILVTTVTETGYQTAQKIARSADRVHFLPFDLLPFPWWGMRQFCPDALILVETELWGNLLHSAKAIGALTVWVNGRISDATYARGRHRLGSAVYRWLLSHLDYCLMRTPEDGDRLVRLIGHSVPSEVVGDLKLEMGSVPLDESRLSVLRQSLGLREGDPVLVAGSTHPGEEEIVLKAYQALRSRFPSLRLILAPRHIDRAGEVADLIARQGLRYRRRTDANEENLDGSEVVILDTVGELAQVYGLATVSFVGGSLIPRGGHNLLEPAFFGVPVLFGPHIDNFRYHGAELVKSGVGYVVRDGDELVHQIIFFLKSATIRQTVSERAQKLLSQHQGVARRIVERVADLLREKRKRR
ncbi:MAG: 3-deoxy-D-manno-octulosonic acid transferase [Armatimonadetes bacterium]|nr:3-deoxy-D-manno-octulosonic acid transferase [Armatimonadota bacterium]MDW8123070.1 3-deoxy-D-manno-octulosonic acid transferase [Armatimonadota bacterium]